MDSKNVADVGVSAWADIYKMSERVAYFFLLFRFTNGVKYDFRENFQRDDQIIAVS